ncbi:hypothetical protein [Streptomyces sp. H39-S7]|uniref:hypothetical protein n=1 Tax=Streptomyces sp. H39-S7 TaxID=3004357 RepID=UPI0022AFED18|nr:hypothetical protein [Streptomyces sp. H39-S7]MCZ4122687.1 hypothetical protein [Streptomyces sp. H39-S7]
MREPSRHWDGAALERKIRSAGRAWTVGDIAMVADGQWAVSTTTAADAGRDDDMAVQIRAADGRRVEMTVEELARAAGSQVLDPRRDEDSD